MSEPQQGIYGIDLGTTYSVVAYIDETGRPTVVRSTEGDDTTPSVVYFETAGNTVVGKTAKEAAGFPPDHVVSLIKREMGNKECSRTFYGQELSPSGISAIILAALAKSAGEETCRPISQAVITVPAYFGLLEQDATKKAGEIAGLEVIGIVSEPVAAAAAYGVTGTADGTTFLVYDLGGGTFDITLIKMTDSSAKVLAVDGDHKIGGADWDARLFDYLKDQTIEQADDDSIGDEASLQELRRLAEDTERALTKAESKKVSHRLAGGMATSIIVTHEQFEQIISDLLEDTIRIIDRMLAGDLHLPRLPRTAETKQHRPSISCGLATAMGSCAFGGAPVTITQSCDRAARRAAQALPARRHHGRARASAAEPEGGSPFPAAAVLPYPGGSSSLPRGARVKDPASQARHSGPHDHDRAATPGRPSASSRPTVVRPRAERTGNPRICLEELVVDWSVWGEIRSISAPAGPRS